MGYRLENKDITISKINLIGYGKSGNVYKHRKEAIKIFPKGDIPRGFLTEESCDQLKRFSTQAILLPRKTARFNDRFSGYSLKLVRKNDCSGNIVNMDVDCLLNSISILEDDIHLLSENGVLLDGITPNNVLVSDQIYITDPSRYSFLRGEFGISSKLEDLNNYQLYLLFCEMITSGLKKNGVSPARLKKIKEILKSKEEDISCSEFFKDLLADCDSIKTFAKKRSL